MEKLPQKYTYNKGITPPPPNHHPSLHPWAQKLCKSWGGCPGLPIPNSPSGLCGCKATFEEAPPPPSPFPRHTITKVILLTAKHTQNTHLAVWADLISSHPHLGAQPSAPEHHTNTDQWLERLSLACSVLLAPLLPLSIMSIHFLCVALNFPTTSPRKRIVTKPYSV